MPAAWARASARRHGRGAVRPALSDGHRQVALGRLAGRAADAVVLAGIDARRGPRRRAPPSAPARRRVDRTAARQRSSASALAGSGRPRLEKIVDSSATTAPPSASAARTSSAHDGLQAATRRSRPAPGAASTVAASALPARTASTTGAPRRPRREEAGGEGVTGAGRVGDDLAPERPAPPGTARRRRARSRPGRAPSFTTVTGAGGAPVSPRSAASSALARSTAGASVSTSSAEPVDAEGLQHGHARRVDAHGDAARPGLRRQRRGRRWRSARRSASRPAGGAR